MSSINILTSLCQLLCHLASNKASDVALILRLSLFGTFMKFWMVIGVHSLMAFVNCLWKMFQLSESHSLSLKVWRKVEMGVGSRLESWQNWTAARLVTMIVGEPSMWGSTLSPTEDALRRPGAPLTSSCAIFTRRKRCSPGTRRSSTSTRGKRSVPFEFSFQAHSSLIRLGLEIGKGI